MTGDWTLDRRGWFVRDEATSFALARRLPLRWDVVAETRLPDLGRRRLAHAVRQDLWRLFQRVRGFAPVVEVTRDARGVTLRAGGAVSGRVPGGMATKLSDFLTDPRFRAAWARAARHRE